MPASNVCWGIEVGAGAIKALKIERNGDELSVLDFAVVPHKRVLSTPGLDVMSATRVALGELVSRYDLSGAMVGISIPGHSSFSRFAKLPPVEPKKIPDVVKFEAAQQIPFPIEDVEWDYQVFARDDSPEVEAGIFAVTRDRVMERLELWRDLGVTPDVVTLSPIAAYNAIAWDLGFDDTTPGTVILDVGATSTDLIVAEPGRAWVRTFPLGGHQFTEALVEGLKLSYPKAEALKRQAEQSKYARHIFQAMRPTFSDLAQDVQRSIGYYQSLHADANLTRLVVLGSTFHLPGLRKYLGQQLHMEVVRLERFNKLQVEGPRAGEFQSSTLNFATAYGLGLQCLGFEFGIQANLIPVPVVRESVWKRKRAWFGVAAALSLAAGGATFIKPAFDKMRVDAAGDPDPVIARTSSELNRLKGDWNNLESSFKTDPKIGALAGLLDWRDVYPWLSADLSQMLQSAAERAGEGSQAGVDSPIGWDFHSFQTQYVFGEGLSTGGGGRDGSRGGGFGAPPPPPMSGANPFDNPRQRGGFNDAGMSDDEWFGGGGGVGGGGAAAGDAVEGSRRISCVLRVSTTRPDADWYMVNTLQQWLYDHSGPDARKGTTPYSIDKSTVRFTLNRREVEAARNSGSGGTAGGSEPFQPRDPGGSAFQPREDRRPGGRRGLQRDPSPNAPATDPNRLAQELETIAPIPEGDPGPEPGTTVYEYTLVWDVVIRDPNAGEETGS